MKVLISSLGESPGVITGVIDTLEAEEEIRIDEVVTISTESDDTKKVIKIFEEEVKDYYNNSFVYRCEAIEELQIKEHAITPFMKKVCKWFRYYRNHNADIYVSLAGGRKTMSAIMMFCAQLYGAKMLFHLQVPKEIEMEGHYRYFKNIRDNPTKRRQALHPCDPSVKSSFQYGKDVFLIRVPFIDLSPFLENFVEILNGSVRKDSSSYSIAKELLLKSGLIQIEDEKIIPVGLGKNLLEALVSCQASSVA